MKVNPLFGGVCPAYRRGRRRFSVICVQRTSLPAVLALVGILVSTSAVTAEDVVELTSGAKIRGTVKQIRKEQKEFDFEAVIGRRTYQRTYSFDRVHAVTMNGKRYVLTEKNAASSDGRTLRTKAAVLKLIQEVGSTPPE